MQNRTDRVVIVGAGQAGGWAAATIRDLQPDRPILIIGAEDHPPYERPPLSKGVLRGEALPESTYLKPRAYYSENSIELVLGAEVTRIDRTKRLVELSNGQTHDYGTLVISAGVRPRLLSVPGSNHERVVYLRALADLPPIQKRLIPGSHIVKIGAGFIGLEAAAAATGAGCRVTVVECASHALNRVIAPEVAEAIVSRHRARGVTFIFDEQVTGITGDSGPATVELAGGGSMVADLVLCGIGGIPNDELARDAGVECADGVLVDETGLTSDPSIYAVGDVIGVPSLASAAYVQGRYAAHHLVDVIDRVRERIVAERVVEGQRIRARNRRVGRLDGRHGRDHAIDLVKREIHRFRHFLQQQ